MKILFVTDLYPLKDDRTIPTIVSQFALAFWEMGNSVSVIRPNFLLNTILRKHKIFKQKTYKIDDIEIFNRNFTMPFIFEDKKFIQNFKDFDIIISHMPSGHLYSFLINKELKLPHISITHESCYHVLNNYKYKLYFKKALEKAIKSSNIIGARNEFLYKKLNADFILPSFIDKKYIIKREYKKSSKLKIITLSKLIKRKNINLVISALSKAKFDFEYNIYGEGKEKANLLKLIKKYNLQEKIKINDFIEHEKIFNKLDENDVFILPSVKESFGVSYLEAISRGLITIGTKNTGISSVIKDNENGFLINPNEKEILNVLNKINSEDLSKMQDEIYKTALKYEKNKIMTKYFDTIKNSL